LSALPGFRKISEQSLSKDITHVPHALLIQVLGSNCCRFAPRARSQLGPTFWIPPHTYSRSLRGSSQSPLCQCQLSRTHRLISSSPGEPPPGPRGSDSYYFNCWQALRRASREGGRGVREENLSPLLQSGGEMVDKRGEHGREPRNDRTQPPLSLCKTRPDQKTYPQE